MGGTYKDLEAWRASVALVENIYRCTASFPREELFGLTSQMRRAAVSIASNIAEGKGRFSDRELVQFLGIARGSAFELETQVEIARALGLLAKDSALMLEDRCAQVGRLLNGLIKAIKSRAA